MAWPFAFLCPIPLGKSFLSPEQTPWRSDTWLPGSQASPQSTKEQGRKEGPGQTRAQAQRRRKPGPTAMGGHAGRGRGRKERMLGRPQRRVLRGGPIASHACLQACGGGGLFLSSAPTHNWNRTLASTQPDAAVRTKISKGSNPPTLTQAGSYWHSHGSRPWVPRVWTSSSSLWH